MPFLISIGVTDLRPYNASNSDKSANYVFGAWHIKAAKAMIKHADHVWLCD